MESRLAKWQHSMIRNNMERYRDSLANYYIKNKPVVEIDGYRAFSLLSPPLGSAAALRRVRSIMKNITHEDTQIMDSGAAVWGSRTPHFITMAVTYTCQCDCEHCSASSYKERVERNQDGLSAEELKDAIRQTIDLGTTAVVFTGGEPLLYQPIYELIRSVEKSKSIATMFTNGEYLTEETVSRLKEAGLFGVFVSLDAPEAAVHDSKRKRSGLFEKAVKGIELCREKGILTGISTYITREKIENGELDAMMDLARELRVLEVFLFDVIAVGKLREHHDCMLGSNDVSDVARFREKYNLLPEYPRIIHQTMFTSIAYPCAAEGCPAGVSQIHLRANGDVTPCDFTPLSFGNIREKPLKEIWESLTKHEIYAKLSPRCRLSDPDLWDRLTQGKPD
ncbi:MAG: radical SAM protein [Thermodesulfovibrionales bacterium]|jgi:MoaA/NifB/PqqE/SkfB family radical SAM enzyme